jgi:hypothetical protein
LCFLGGPGPAGTLGLREASTNSPFDILKKKPEGSFRWFEAVNDLESANIRIKELIALSPGEYVVFD